MGPVDDAADNPGSSSSSLISDFLSKSGGVAVIDGGLATELERHGADLNDPLWSAKCLHSSPHLIRSVHLDYLEAGADVIITASYQATIQGFKARGFSQEEIDNQLLVVEEQGSSDVTAKPILIYPNSGESYDADRKEWVQNTGVSDEDFVSYVNKWCEVGASLVGGCCRTTPSTINAIYRTLRYPTH
nr:homocysteine S-methyltransferase 2-like [Coffea arabica]